MEYGAGPSRIPYQPQTPPFPLAPLIRQAPIRLYPDDQERGSIREFRQRLKGAQLGHRRHVVGIKGFLRYHNLTPLEEMSRLELHILMHSMIWTSTTGEMISSLVFEEVAALEKRGRPGRRRWLHPRTLIALVDCHIRMAQQRQATSERVVPEDIDLGEWKSRGLPLSAEDEAKPLISTRRSRRRPSRELARLLQLHDRLQSIRHPRSVAYYQLLVQQCIDEKFLDLAAKLYVGLIEEWVTEGRVASGADAEDFYPGGGPPREHREEMELRSDLLSTWWKGIRSWALPGEVLSPHDRLDLWHPRHLALSEKLVSFPYPLPHSPPILVPEPGRLLSRILTAMEGNLDAQKAPTEEFKSSMRACAILASIILNRTIPYGELGRLLDVLGRTPLTPPVYPESISSPPNKKDAWAFQASTHIHVALQSVLFYPPVSRRYSEYVVAVENAKVSGTPPPSPPPELYMMHPLNYRACVVMVRYALRKIRRPEMLKRLWAYVRGAFGTGEKIEGTGERERERVQGLEVATEMETRTDVHKALFDGVARLGDRKVGDVLEKAYFGEQIGVARSLERRRLDRREGAPRMWRSGVRTRGGLIDPMISSVPAPLPLDTNSPSIPSAPSSAADAPEIMSVTQAAPFVASDYPTSSADSILTSSSSFTFNINGQSLNPDTETLISLILHLTSTHQYNRLISLIYELIPFLQFAKSMTATQVDTLVAEKGLTKGTSGRPAADPLPMSVYAALLYGIEKAGNTSLAQRVFKLALCAETDTIAAYQDEFPGEKVPESMKVPMGCFTSMIKVWHDEMRLGHKQEVRRPGGRDTWGYGWIPEKSIGLRPRGEGATAMIIWTYQLARQRPSQPTYQLFEAYIRACHQRWSLDDDNDQTPLRSNDVRREEIKELINDMIAAQYQPPKILLDKVGWRGGREGLKEFWAELRVLPLTKRDGGRDGFVTRLAEVGWRELERRDGEGVRKSWRERGEGGREEEVGG